MINKYIGLDTLPTWSIGLNKGKINWYKSVGSKVKFQYDDIEGELEIVGIETRNKRRWVKIRYNSIEVEFDCSTLKTVPLGKLLGKINSEYKYEIGDIVANRFGKIEILEKIRMKNNNGSTQKGYKYKCCIDGNIGERSEGSINKGEGCSICSKRLIKEWINTIAQVRPDLIDLFVIKELAYIYGINSTEIADFICPNCNHIKSARISDVCRHGLSCPMCSDGVKYPEKLMYNVLHQLGIKAEKNKKFEWSINIKHENEALSGDKIYDFYFIYKGKSYIIETHGIQHYEKGFEAIGGRTLQDEQENDKLKEDLALPNVDYYIAIDCRISELEFIKENICNSQLNNLFSLDSIDWIKCENNARSSLLKKACDYWNNGLHDVSKIAKEMNMNRNTIGRYLRQGSNIGICSYNLDEEIEKRKIKALEESIRKKHKPVRCTTEGYEDIRFNSLKELCENSEDIFGVHIPLKGLSSVVTGARKSYKSFTFELI